MLKKAQLESGQLREQFKRFLTVALLSIAFAYVEAAVVVYLREIFYPEGFIFPLGQFGLGVSPLWRRILLTEVAREAATLVLMATCCLLAGRTRRLRFAYFLVIFAIWDIFYYVWLKVLVDWPASVMDWDILFLIPTTWASPVLAPVIVSLTMLLAGSTIIYRDAADRPVRFAFTDVVLSFCAAVVLVTNFCRAGSHITEPDFSSYFSWLVFGTGEILACGAVLRLLLKSP